MNIDQLAIQLTAINDAVQILARSNATVVAHTKDIDGLLQKTSKNDERIREIETLIHQSCELKTKEINDTSERIDQKLSRVYDVSFGYAWKFSAVVGGVGLGMFYYTFGTMDNYEANHSAYEKTQDEKSDKIFAELFGVMRDIRNDIGAMKSDMAVIKAEQKHYQKELADHMVEEAKKWSNK
jgi:hypothetical protein